MRERTQNGLDGRGSGRKNCHPPPDIPKRNPGAVVAATGAKGEASRLTQKNNSSNFQTEASGQFLHARLIAERELLEAWRAVANAKLKEYRHQAKRLAQLVGRGIVTRSAAIDRLWEIATAHALVRSLGEDGVQAILSEAFAGAAFHPMHAEAAE